MIHKHKCPKRGCGFIWEHDPNCISETEEAYTQAHACPRCGTDQRWKYDGSKRAQENNVSCDSSRFYDSVSSHEELFTKMLRERLGL